MEDSLQLVFTPHMLLRTHLMDWRMAEDRDSPVHHEDNDFGSLIRSWIERDMEVPHEGLNSLISSIVKGDVHGLRRFMSPFSNAMIDFHRDLWLYCTYDDHGSTLLQIAIENGHSEIVQLLLSHEQQYSLSYLQDGARSNIPFSFELVSRVLLLVYYVTTVSEQKVEGRYSMNAPFVLRLIDFMSRHSNVLLSQDDNVRLFIGSEPLLASYNKLKDAQHIVLLWAFAPGAAEYSSTILEELKTEFAEAFDLFSCIFSDKRGESSSSATKDLKFFFGRLVRALKFEMLHARSRLRFDTALHTATLTERADIAHILLKHYDDVADHDDGSYNFLDVNSMTPLHYAVMLKSEPLIKELLHSATYVKHVNARDWCLRTPLHLACVCGIYEDTASSMQLQVVKMLVIDKKKRNSKNIDLNAKDCCGFTPLHWAVHVRASEVVRFLLSFKGHSGDGIIRTTEKDVDEKSVLQHAMEDVSTSTNGGNDLSSKEARKKEIERLLMSQPGVKDEIDLMYRDRQVYVDAANAILVGAALIASVTYGGWLEPPSGADDDELTLARLKIFWAFNSLSFFSAIATVMAGAGAVLPVADVYIEESVRRVRDWLALTSLLLLISITFVLGAFAAAGFVSELQHPSFGDNMVATTVTGSLLCCTVGLSFLRGLSRVNKKWPWMRLVRWARRVWHHYSGIFGYKVRVKCTLRDLDLQGGTAHVWHIHFALLMRQYEDKRRVIHVKDLDSESLQASERSVKALRGNMVNEKYRCRPVLPACAHDPQFVGDRGVQHAIIHMSSTSDCRQHCIDRDCALLREIRARKAALSTSSHGILVRECWNV